MARSALVIVLLVLSAVVRSQEAVGPSPGPPESRTIRFYLTATDKRGKPVEGLTSESIGVAEDESPCQVVSLKSASQQPMSFALMLDVSGSNRDKTEFMKKAASQMLDVLNTPGSQGVLIWFDDRTHMLDKAVTQENLHKFAIHLGVGGGTALFDAVLHAADVLTKLHQADAASWPTRRVIAILSDGEDNASAHTREEAIEAAIRAHASMVTVEMISSAPLAQGRGDANMRELARRTGGEEVKLRGGSDSLDGFAHSLAAQYEVSCIPAAPANDGKEHRLEVKPLEKGLVLNSPDRYLAPTE